MQVVTETSSAWLAMSRSHSGPAAAADADADAAAAAAAMALSPPRLPRSGLSCVMAAKEQQ
jgi:hypothetical protein